MEMTEATRTSLTKRPYAAPQLVVHGDVQALTLGKTATDLDLDSTGSFIPDSGQ